MLALGINIEGYSFPQLDKVRCGPHSCSRTSPLASLYTVALGMAYIS